MCLRSRAGDTVSKSADMDKTVNCREESAEIGDDESLEARDKAPK